MSLIELVPDELSGRPGDDEPSADEVGGEPAEKPVDRLRRRLEGLLGVPATEGNRLTLLHNGDQIFPAMLESIRQARRSVDLMTFVYWQGDIARDFARTLAETSSRGVRVRVLLDAIGGRLMDTSLITDMREAGVDVLWFRRPFLISPFKQNHRCHRKVLVCDETVAYTGGVGIAEEWCGDARDATEWRDTHVRVEGPAVDGLRAAFAQNWAESGRPLAEEIDRFPVHEQPGDSVVQVIRGSASIGWSDMATVFRTVLESAQERVRITTAYFAPDPSFLQLLAELAARDVEVDVLLPGPHADKRACQLASERTYAELTDAGVRVWNFQPSMLHAKVLTVDGTIVVLGSSNVNRRSMEHDEEVVLVVFDAAVVRQLDDDFVADLERSKRINLDHWRDRGLVQKAAEAATIPIKRWF